MSMGSRGLLGLGVRQTPASPSLPLASSTLPYSSPPMSTFSTQHQPGMYHPLMMLSGEYVQGFELPGLLPSYSWTPKGEC